MYYASEMLSRFGRLAKSDAFGPGGISYWRRIGMIKPPVQLGVSKIS